jgi:hypothetical protein
VKNHQAIETSEAAGPNFRWDDTFGRGSRN